MLSRFAVLCCVGAALAVKECLLLLLRSWLELELELELADIELVPNVILLARARYGCLSSYNCGRDNSHVMSSQSCHGPACQFESYLRYLETLNDGELSFPGTVSPQFPVACPSSSRPLFPTFSSSNSGKASHLIQVHHRSSRQSPPLPRHSSSSILHPPSQMRMVPVTLAKGQVIRLK